jgi:hypothetical protein
MARAFLHRIEAAARGLHSKSGGAAFAALLFVVLAMAAPQFGAAGAGAGASLVIETSSGPKSISVEIADTPAKQAFGLKFRRSMPPDHGMLFLFGGEREVQMWMQDTFISLDMLFISAEGRVMRIAENAEPFSEDIISSQGPASAVLELNAGAARRLGVKVGDLVRHPAFPMSR